jgi:hypothetical protein
MMLQRICLSLALIGSYSLFGADAKIEYYKITNDLMQKTLLVPKSYFDTVCQNGKERKWVFGLGKEGINRFRVFALDFSLLEEHKPEKNKHTYKVRCLSWHPRALDMIAKKYTLLKYIEKHGEEEFRKKYPEGSDNAWDRS